MNLSDYLLGTLGLYGPVVLFVVLIAGCAGVPTPGTLLLLVAGSFVEQGEMKLWQVLALALAGSVVGDNVGYFVGRWGGRRLVARLTRRFGGDERLKSAEAWLRRWEGGGVFITRWLLTPLGPFVNFMSGVTGYAWPRFLFYDLLGEALWVTLYVLLGEFFSDQIEDMSEVFGDFIWAAIGLLFAVLLGWALWRQLRAPAPRAKELNATGSAFD